MDSDRRSTGSGGNSAELIELLRASVAGPVDASSRRRAEYSSDASNYRVVPQVVVFPRDVDDILAAAAVARRRRLRSPSAAAGTSVAGNAVGPGIVLDFSRHVNRVLDVRSGRRAPPASSPAS